MTGKSFFTLGILFFGSLLGSHAMARPEVVFSNEMEVSNAANVRMLEVAEFKDFSFDHFQKLSQVILWEAKDTPEESTTLSQAELSKKLRDVVAGDAELKKMNPAFRIPDQVKLTFSKTGVSRQAVERALRNSLSAKCSDCVYKMKISSVPSMRTNTWIVDYDTEIKSGSFMVSVNDLQSTSTQWISGSVNTKKNVPVLKKSIRFGERLQAEDIEMNEMDITFQRERTPDVNSVVGSVANRTLQAGTTLIASDFKKEPAAKRGQILKAMIGDDTFEVSINVTAEENGSIGDTIKIQNPETKKMMSAVVIDKGVVKVQ